MSSFNRFRSSNDSALGSLHASNEGKNSQSQFSLSQMSTQDMFSQVQNPPSQYEQCSQDRNQKMSMYEKWLSRKSSAKQMPGFSSDSMPKSNKTMSCNDIRELNPTGKINANMPAKSSFEASHYHNVVPSRLPDDREMLKQVLCTFQDFNAEIFSSLREMKHLLETKDKAFSEEFSEAVKSFLEDIWKHEEKILDSISQQNAETVSVKEIERKLTQRESKIESLTKLLEDAKAEKMDAFIATVKDALMGTQQSLETLLKEREKRRSVSKEEEVRLLTDMANNIVGQGEEVSNLCRTQKQGFRDFEKRLLSELQKQYRESIRKQEASRKYEAKHLTDFFENHTLRLEEIIKKQVTQGLQNLKPVIEQLVMEKQCQMITDVIRNHAEVTTSNMKNMLYEHHKEIEQDLKGLQEKVKAGQMEYHFKSKSSSDHRYIINQNPINMLSNAAHKSDTYVGPPVQRKQLLAPVVTENMDMFQTNQTSLTSPYRISRMESIEVPTLSTSLPNFHSASHNSFGSFTISQPVGKKLGPSPVATVLPHRSDKCSTKSSQSSRKDKLYNTMSFKRPTQLRSTRSNSHLQTECSASTISSMTRSSRKRKAVCDSVVDSWQSCNKATMGKNCSTVSASIEKNTVHEAPIICTSLRDLYEFESSGKSSNSEVKSTASSPSIEPDLLIIQRKVRTPFSRCSAGSIRYKSSRLQKMLSNVSPAKTMLSMSTIFD